MNHHDRPNHDPTFTTAQELMESDASLASLLEMTGLDEVAAQLLLEAAGGDAALAADIHFEDSTLPTLPASHILVAWEEGRESHETSDSDSSDGGQALTTRRPSPTTGATPTAESQRVGYGQGGGSGRGADARRRRRALRNHRGASASDDLFLLEDFDSLALQEATDAEIILSEGTQGASRRRRRQLSGGCITNGSSKSASIPVPTGRRRDRSVRSGVDVSTGTPPDRGLSVSPTSDGELMLQQ